MGAVRTPGLVVLLLAVAGCGGSEDDSAPEPEYRTTLTIAKDQGRLYHGWVLSKSKACSVGRRVLLFEQRRGEDHELGTNRSGVAPVGVNAVGQFPEKDWAIVPSRSITLRRGARIYATTPREERSGHMCQAARSKVLLHEITID